MFNRILKKWLRSSHRSSTPDDESRLIDHILEMHAYQLNSIDPRTDTQWLHLQEALNASQNVAEKKYIFKQYSWKPSLALVVIAAMLLLAGSILVFHPLKKTYSTVKAQHSTLTLADGTEVSLNHTSEMIVEHSLFSRARRVSLNGEALFYVRKNGTPFIITSDVGTVEVLGTQFNVRVRNGKMEVAVLSGCVKITARKYGIDSSIVVTKDQIALCKKNEFPELPKALPFTSYPGWINDKFIFYHSNFADVCEELEAQFDIVIKIQNPQWHKETITGMLDGKTVESALTSLMQLTGTTYRYENGCYTIE